MISTLLLLAALAQAASTPARHVFITAETDSGAPVADIAPGDLQITVGGHAARVVSVVHATSGAPSETSRGRDVLFLFDEAHIAAPHAAALKQLVTWIVHDVSAGTTFSIRTSSGRAYLPETTDTARVAPALAHLDAALARNRSAALPNTDRASTQSLLRSYADDNALDGLRRAASTFKDDGRRHVIVWVTSAFMNPALSARAERAAAALLDHNVFVYAVNAAAAIAIGRVAFLDAAPDRELTYPGQSLHGFRIVREIAERCGGFALIGGNALRGAVTRLLYVIDDYYDLTIESTPAAHGSFVEVTTSRPGVIIRTPERLAR